MNSFFSRHKPYWKQKQFTAAVSIALAFLFCSLVVNNYANIFALKSASNPVTDIILDNIPLLNVGPVIIYGTIALIIFIAFLVLVEPKRMPFVLKTTALFILIRAIFITLTHVAPFPGQIPVAGNWLSNLFNMNGTADLFFSGNTGFPFLMMFVFWDHKIVRLIFLMITIAFGLIILFTHSRYSIDVFGALFITYAIYALAKKIFPSAYHLFLEGSYAK